MADKIEIPEQVKDKEAYLQYLKYVDLPVITLPGRIIETSDIHTSIDPFVMRDIIEKSISHLPKDEQEDILKKVKACLVVQEKMLTLRAKAYGILRNHKSLSKSRAKALLDERSSEILEYYGRYLDDREVLKIINIQWGYNISMYVLERFKNNNKEKIKRLQETFRKDLNTSKMYHKKYRLEELAYLYRDRKENYLQTKSRDDVKIMMSLLRQAKDEAEAHQLHITGEFNHKVELSINEHLQQEIQLNMVVKEIILARVSHRLGVNPSYLLNRLRNSIYSKFTGFVSPQGSLFDQEIQYPSSMVYNWNEIEKRQKNDYTDFEDVKETEKTKLDDLKSQLMAKLGNKKNKIQSVKSNVNKNTD